MSCQRRGYPWPSLATSPYRSSPLTGLQGYIPYPHIAAVCMFELVVLLLPGHIGGPSLISRVFANSTGDWGSILGQVIPKTQKMLLDATLLNTHYYKVRFKGKVEQSSEWSSTLPTPWVNSYWKRDPLSHPWLKLPTLQLILVYWDLIKSLYSNIPVGRCIERLENHLWKMICEYIW